MMWCAWYEQIVTETDSIRVYNVHKQQHVDYQGAVDYFGVEPDLIPQVQSLAGDKVDGIPGIPGVGLKTAAKLLRKYGTVAEIVRQAESGGCVSALRMPFYKKKKNDLVFIAAVLRLCPA